VTDNVPSADPTPPRPPRSTGPIQYRGDDLTADRGPGLGCFRFQLIVLVVFIVLTPLSVAWDWPPAISAGLLFAVILLLLVAGQTIIFLLRLVAADRRGRRRPLGSATRTVGELEDEGTEAAEAPDSSAEPEGASAAEPGGASAVEPGPPDSTRPRSDSAAPRPDAAK
jgi:hypothetical protein